jgi:16S rRNA (guanine966-N2)-methyltransferase
VRISGGQAKGIPLHVPKGVNLRPATEANRERLFSSLGESIIQASFLDLFAGTGSYGLEAISRGAQDGVFVENNRKAQSSLKNNLAKVCKSAHVNPSCATVQCRDVIEFLKNENQSFNLVFLDPPYPLFPKIGNLLFEIIREKEILKKDGLLIHEAPSEADDNFTGWKILRKTGKSKRGSPQFRFFQLLD